MTTMANITAGLINFDPLLNRICPRCGAEHHRVDRLCQDCRTKDLRNRRAAGMKGHRIRKRMLIARASIPVAKAMELERNPWPDSHLMLRALLSSVLPD